MSVKIELSIENYAEFQRSIDRAKQVTNDLRIPFTSIAKHWFQGNKSIFTLKGKGKYEDLSPDYKVWKTRKLGSPYPILKLTGRLEKSLTNPTAPEAVSEVVNKDTLLLGTRVPYAGHLHYGTKNMPARPVVFIGPEEPYVSNMEHKKRPKIWIEIMNDFIAQKLKQIG